MPGMSRKRQATGKSICKGGGIAQRKIGNDKGEIAHGCPVILWEIFLHKKGRDGFPGPLLSYFTKCQLFSFT